MHSKSRRLSRVGVWGGGAIIFALLVIYLVSFLIEGPLRRQMEGQINRSLKGYSVNLQELDFHPIGLAVTLKDLVIRQDAYPDPPYRVFLDSMEFQLINLSNQFSHGEALARLQGNFMGSGQTLATATFRPETSGPDFDLNVKIEGTQLKAMNDLLRVYGNFDVVAGSFSLYSEIRVKNDQTAYDIG